MHTLEKRAAKAVYIFTGMADRLKAESVDYKRR